MIPRLRPIHWIVLTASLCALGCAGKTNIGENHDAGVDAPTRTGPYDECGNGMDDDGDGQIDEDCFCGGGETQPCFSGTYPNRGVGACADGVQRCDATSTMEFGHWGACTMDTLPAEEACDGVDNDCDGAIDEGCPCTAGQTQGCGSEFAIAPCSAGTQTCGTDGTWSACEGAIGPSAEVCGTGAGDGIDNDCDGLTDEGCTCVPEPEVCSDGVDNDCDGDVDEASCRIDMTLPDACVAAPTEVCGDGVDNDCDGMVDELDCTHTDLDGGMEAGPDAGPADAGSDAGMMTCQPWIVGRLSRYLKASNTGADDRFGTAVALSADGSTIAVGAFLEDSAAVGVGGDQSSNSAQSSGAVYVFTRSGAGWSQQAYLKASNTKDNNYFGDSLSISADGSTLAVGAYRERSSATGVGGDQVNEDAPESGAVYVFQRSGSTWSQQAYIKASNAFAGALFGRHDIALSADGSTLAVGAGHEESDSTGVGGDQTNDTIGALGAVYVFTRIGSTWSQQAYIKASNTGADDWFGESLALSDDGATLAVGARGEASNATGVGGNQANNSARGVPPLVDGAGAVYVFTRSGSIWSQQAYIKASNTEAGDGFGSAVALSADGSSLAVGAIGEDSNATGVGGDQANNAARGVGNSTFDGAGAVYVFTRSGSTWSQQAYVKASNTQTGAAFGGDLAFANDGSILAVGASGEDSNATGIGGDQSNRDAQATGATYIFARSGSTWSQQAYVKASNSERLDHFGASVALSADACTLAVGAWGEDSSATGLGGDESNNDALQAGAVYVF